MKVKSFLITFLSIFLLTSCSRKENDDYKIGVVFGLGGKYASLGTQLRDGLYLAFDEINYQINGKDIVLVTKDDKQDKQTDKKVISDLIKQNIKIIIGNATSSMTKVSLDTIRDKNILLFSPTASSAVFAKIDDNLIRLRGSFDTKPIINFIQKNKFNKIVLIGDNHNKTYLYNYKVVLKNDLKKIDKSYVTFIDSNLELSKISNKLKNTKYDLIILLANSVDSVKIIQYLRMHQVKVPFLISSWALAGKFIENIGTYSNNLYFPIVKDKLIDKKEYKKFYNNFIQTYKKEPRKFNNDGYVVGKILIETIKKVGLAPKKVKQYILSHTFKVNGIIYEFDKFGDLKEDYAVVTIKNNKLVEVK